MSGPVTCTPRISSGSVERNGLAGSTERTGSKTTLAAPAEPDRSLVRPKIPPDAGPRPAGRTTPSAPPCTRRCARGGTCRSSAALPVPARQLLYSAWSQNGFRDAEQSERWRARAAGWLTDYVAGLDPTDEPVGTERTVGATTERLALSGRVDRIDQRGDELVVVDYKTGRCPAPTTRRAAHRRWPPTCSASGARCAGRAAGSSCTTCPAARSPRSSTPSGRWPTTSAGPRTSPSTSPPPPRRWPPAQDPDEAFPAVPGGSAAGATSGRAARPARRRRRRGRRGASSPRTTSLNEAGPVTGRAAKSGGRCPTTARTRPATIGDRRARCGSRSSACRKALQRRPSPRRR